MRYAAALILTFTLATFTMADEFRYGYSVEHEAIHFQNGEKHMFGYRVLKMSKMYGNVKAYEIGGRLIIKWEDADGREEIYIPSPNERLMITENPIPLHVCPGGTFITAPHQGIRIDPPKVEIPVNPDPVVPEQPKQLMPSAPNALPFPAPPSMRPGYKSFFPAR